MASTHVKFTVRDPPKSQLAHSMTLTCRHTHRRISASVNRDVLYAIELAWPSTGKPVIHSFATGAAGDQLKVDKGFLPGDDVAI
jgi:hypothetical protein